MRHLVLFAMILLAFDTEGFAQSSLNWILGDDDETGYIGANWMDSSATANPSRTSTYPPVGYTPSNVAYSSNYEQVKAAIHTPQQASSYIKENFDYVSHGNTTALATATLNSQKSGDCKDFATFFTDVLVDDGYTGNVVGYEYAGQPRNGHSVGVVNGNGTAYMESSYDLYQVGSMQDVFNIENYRNGDPSRNVGNVRYFPMGYTGSQAAW